MNAWSRLLEPKPVEFGRGRWVYNPWDLPRGQFIWFTTVVIIAASFVTFAGGTFVGTMLGIGDKLLGGDFNSTFWIGFWTSSAVIAIPSYVPYLRLYFSKRARARMLLRHTIGKSVAKAMVGNSQIFAVSSNEVFGAMDEVAAKSE